MSDTARHCPACGGSNMQLDVRTQVVSYQGESRPVRMRGLYCGHCGESVHTWEEMAVADEALREMRQPVLNKVLGIAAVPAPDGPAVDGEAFAALANGPDVVEALRRFYRYGEGTFPDQQPPRVLTWGSAQVRMVAALGPFLDERDKTRGALPETLRDGNVAHAVASLALAHLGAHDSFYRYGRALCIALAFLDKAAGEGLSFVAEENGFPEMDAGDLCGLIAEAIGAEIDGPVWQALLSAGRERIAKAAAAAEVPAWSATGSASPETAVCP